MSQRPKKYHGPELKCGGPGICSDCTEKQYYIVTTEGDYGTFYSWLLEGDPYSEPKDWYSTEGLARKAARKRLGLE